MTLIQDVRIHEHKSVYICVCVCIYIYIYIYMYIHMFIYMYVCVYVCVCLFVCVTRRFLNEKVVYAGEEREIIACNRN